MSFFLTLFECFVHRDVQCILCFCLVFLRLVYPMLSVSLDCPFLIAPSIFSNVYLIFSWGMGM